MIKRKPKPQTIIEIELSNGWFSYGQVLNDGSIAFFKTNKKKYKSILDLTQLEIIFIVKPYDLAYRNWNTIGKFEIRPSLKVTPNKFIQDSINPENFEIYNPNTGEIRKAMKEECIGLECASVWESKHIEDRIIDYYNGKENIWVKILAIK